MTKIFALTIGLAAVGMAAQASAVTISFQYDGVISGTGTETATATAFYTNPVGVLGTGLTYSYLQTASFTGGSGTVSTAAGSINFTFTGTYSSAGVSGGILSFTGGTGAYAGYNGVGSLSHTVYPPTNGQVSRDMAGQFDAEINPVPEPTSMVALGLGAVAVIRRRVRRSN